jgi:predicted permease
VLGLAGGALGLLLAVAGVRGLLALAPTPIPLAAQVGIDLPILAFNLALSLATGLALGLVPAIQGSRSVVEAMRGGGRGQTEGKRSARTRAALVMAEVGLSLVLLVGAGLLLRTLHRLQGTNPGFKPERVLAVQLSLPKSRYASPEALARYADQIGARLSSLPGVRAAAAASLNPLTNWRATVSFLIEGRPDMDRRQAPGANYRAVGAGYFRALGVPLLEGREIDGRDRADGAPVALISDTLARRYFPKGSPIGARLTIDDSDPWRPVEVVGVVGDIKHTGLDAEGTADVYVPYAQTSKSVSGYLANIFCVAVRSDAPPRQLAAAVRAEVRALDRDVAVAAIRPMDEAFGDSLAQRRFQTGLLEVFGAAALLLALAGIYSVTAFSVVERTREIGVRISLGSGRGRILGLVFRQAMLPVGVGILFGGAAALGLGRLVAGLLFGVHANDPATLGVSAVLVALAAFLASAIPALRATRIDPVRALRAE